MIKQCLVCDNLFEVCQSCDKQSIFFKDSMYQWRKVVCCPEHFHYHIIIIEYVRKEIDKTTAKSRLQEIIKDYGMIEFNDNVKGIVNEILADDIVEQELKQTKTISKRTKK